MCRVFLELDYEQALVQFLKVIEIEPMNPRGYTGAAEAYIGLGDSEKAMSILEKGLMQTENDKSVLQMMEKLSSKMENQEGEVELPESVDVIFEFVDMDGSPCNAEIIDNIIVVAESSEHWHNDKDGILANVNDNGSEASQKGYIKNLSYDNGILTFT